MARGLDGSVFGREAVVLGLANSGLAWEAFGFSARGCARGLAGSTLGLAESVSRGRGDSAPSKAELLPGMGDSTMGWASGPGNGTGAVPGPVEAHAEVATPAASKHNSSALLRRLAGNMALLGEDVRQYCPCQGPAQVF